MKYIVPKILQLTLFLTILINTYSQNKKLEVQAKYISEIQTNYNKKYNWINLLSFQTKLKLWHNGSFSLQTISTYNIFKERIIDDLQVFSNIEEDNAPINLILTGYTHSFNKFLIFTGIRNVNMDYFTGEYTSIFTNSSCGIYPTISANHQLANYPLAGLCVHEEIKFLDNIILKNSTYDGLAGDILKKNSSLFSFNIPHNGILNITELSYLSKSNLYSFYTIGSIIGNDNNGYNLNKKFNFTIWGSIEKCLYKSGKKEFGLLAQTSIASEKFNDCKYYYGFGLVWKDFLPIKRVSYIATFINNAYFLLAKETLFEITFQCIVSQYLTIQPTFNYIITGDKKYSVGLIRCNFTVNNSK